MAKQTINIGTSANDGTGSTLREAFDITNDNFTELYDGTGGLLHKIGGTNFSNSLLIGHSTTGTLSSAQNNVGIGIEALQSLTSGDRNIAIGKAAGKFINNGSANIIIGDLAGDSLTSGGSNIAIGRNALSSEDTTAGTVAIGHRVLQNQNATSTSYNVAVGYTAGKEITTGIKNTIIGGLAGDALTTGQDNTLLGYNAGTNATGNNNTLIGSGAGSSITGGTNNIMIGKDTDLATNASNSIIIGTGAGSGSIGSNTIVFGDSNITDVIIPSDSTLKIGAGSDLQLEHVSSNSFIKNTAVGDLYIENQVDDADVIFRSDNGSGGLMTYFSLDGSDVRINVNATNGMQFMDDVKAKFGTSGDLTIRHDSSNSIIENSVGDLRFTNKADDKDIVFQTDDGSGGVTTYFSLDGSATNTKVYKDMRFLNNVDAQFGTNGDFKLYHDSSNMYLEMVNSGAGDIIIQNANDDNDIIFKSDDGSGGLMTYLTIDGSAGLVNLPDNIPLAAGTGNDLRIFHESGSTSKIENYTGNLTIQQRADDSDIVFQCDDGSGGLAEYFRVDGGTGDTRFSKNTRHLDNVRAEFGSSGNFVIKHDGDDTLLQCGSSGGNLTLQVAEDDHDMIFQCDNGTGGVTEYFRLDGSATQIKIEKETIFADNVKADFGAGADLQIYHNGTNSVIDNITGDLFIRQFTDDGDIKFQSDDGSGGTTEYFRVDGGEGRLVHSVNSRYIDNAQIMLGTGADLQILHDGTNSFIQNSTGQLQIIQNTDDEDIIFLCDNGSGGVAEYLRLDGSNPTVKFSKSSIHTDNIGAYFGTGLDLQIYHDSSNSYIENHTNDLIILNNANDKDIVFQCDDGSGGVETYFRLDGSVGGSDPVTRFPDSSQIQFGSDGDSSLRFDGSKFEVTNSTGDFEIINYADDSDIIFKSDDGSGGVTEYFRLDGSTEQNVISKNMRFEDNIQCQFGAGTDLRIYHDGSDSYIKDSGTGSLSVLTNTFSVKNAAGNEAMLNAIQDGAVNLYYNGTGPKLSTESGGVLVTGDLEIANSSDGIILESPNGTRFRITVDNSGNLSTTSL